MCMLNKVPISYVAFRHNEAYKYFFIFDKKTTKKLVLCMYIHEENEYNVYFSTAPTTFVLAPLDNIY
jgi:hypothetical protein